MYIFEQDGDYVNFNGGGNLWRIHKNSQCVAWHWDETGDLFFDVYDQQYVVKAENIATVTIGGIVLSTAADFETNIKLVFPGLAGSSSSILVATKTIEDADIKTLPTTQVEIVAAPGSGKMIVPISISIVTNFITTGYTNLAADIRIGIPMQSGNVLNTSSWMVFDADAFGVFDPQGTKWLYNPPINYDGVSAVENLPNDDIVNLDNVALKLKVINGANGNFTGGDINNNMKITISYMIVDL